jgi:hypothetical protein
MQKKDRYAQKKAIPWDGFTIFLVGVAALSLG